MFDYQRALYLLVSNLCSTDVLNLTGQQEKEGRVADGVEEAEVHAHE
jgi:hypothetical protein